MGKYRWLKSECLHVVGDLESKRLKVAALNLFHPTASPFCEEPCFHIATQPLDGGGRACLPVGRGGGV